MESTLMNQQTRCDVDPVNKARRLLSIMASTLTMEAQRGASPVITIPAYS